MSSSKCRYNSLYRYDGLGDIIGVDNFYKNILIRVL